ncbi:MAG: hypothetical protein J6C87_00505, partial [Bacteroides sp.]|nr:hypothetical protein [Bacteroides sp.]
MPQNLHIPNKMLASKQASKHRLSTHSGRSERPDEGVSKIGTPSFFITKPLLSQARTLVYPKVFVSLGIQKIHYAKDTSY